MTKPKRAKCEVCNLFRVINRYGYCRVCWKAQDRTVSNFDSTSIFTSSHTIADILHAKASIRGIMDVTLSHRKNWKPDNTDDNE